tara:strand:- start:207 stop:521 length:315 start_codon:yes stop_codon:yes gene_type:complete
MSNLDEAFRVREDLLNQLVRSWKTLAILESESEDESWDPQMAKLLDHITETTKDIVELQDAIQRVMMNLHEHEERIQELSEGQEVSRDNLYLRNTLVLLGDDME